MGAGRELLDKAIPGALAISCITLAELHFGVMVAKTSAVRAERLRRLSLLQQHFEALPVDEAVAASHGRLAQAVVEAGRRPPGRVMDLLIAATAHAHDAHLHTRNPGTSRAWMASSPSSPWRR